MNLHLHMNGGGVSKDNDFSAYKNAQTTNHIYLNPSSNQGEYNDWMRRIGSLIQVGDSYAALKPVLELIVAVLEPDRLFVISHEALQELEVDPMFEIIVVLNESQIGSKKLVKGILNMLCFKESNVGIHFETSEKVERGITSAYPHYCSVFTEDNLVFSSNPYRLTKPSKEALAELQVDLPHRIDQLLTQARLFLSEADQLAKKDASNLAALMLHQCMEYLYKNVLHEFDRTYYRTHCLSKLHSKVKKLFPQACSQISDTAINTLNDARKYITAPVYDVGETWNVQNILEEVRDVLETMKIIFEKRIALLF